jgi:hypothetical protein
MDETLPTMNEQQLFDLIKSVIPDLQSMDQYSYRDAYSPKYDLTIELKCRQKHYDFLLIEKIKYDKLIKHNRVRYINSTPIGIFSFDLKKIEEPTWYEYVLPKETEFYNRNKIPKIVGMLTISQAEDLSHLLRRI